MARPAVLVLSTSWDAHVPPVVHALEARDVPVVRLDTDRFWPDVHIEVHHAEGSAAIHVRVANCEVDGRDIVSVWNRRPEPPTIAPWLDGEEARQFAREESAVALHGTLRALDARWLSHPDPVRAASFKPAQLGTAVKAGFPVPRTLIARDPDRVRAFVATCGGTVAAKLVSPGTPRTHPDVDQYSVFTTAVTTTDLRDDRAIEASPAIYQELLRKRRDLRVTVVGTSVFACAIDSQAHPDAATDWRRVDPAAMRHDAIELDGNLRRRCVEFTSALGLGFSTIDLVEDESGRVFFLELNPNGQWLWVEEATGLPISGAIADWLAGRQVSAVRQAQA